MLRHYTILLMLVITLFDYDTLAAFDYDYDTPLAD